MIADIEPPALEIESQRLGDGFDEEPLPVQRKFPGEHVIRGR